MLIGYLIPVACCLVASLVIWIVGSGFPSSNFVHQAAGLLGLGGAPDWVIIAMFVGLSRHDRQISGVGAALGEEIGWRGFLSLRSRLRRKFAHDFRFGSTTEACG